MNRPTTLKTTIICIVLAGMALLLVYGHGMTWAGISWAIIVMLVSFLLSIFAYVGYVILSLEFGYKSEDQKPRGMCTQSSHAHRSLETLLHLRIVRHR
jgi:hypothetical protein